MFPDEETARLFSERVGALGCVVSTELTRTVDDFPWDVVVVKRMAPSHKGIGDFEEWLRGVASRFGGHNDGWGCSSSREPEE